MKKNILSIVVGFLCLGTMLVTPAMKSQGDYTVTKAAPPPPCDGVCIKLNLPNVVFNQYGDKLAQCVADWSLDKVFDIDIVAVAAPVWHNSALEPSTIVGDEKFLGKTTVTGYASGYEFISGYPDYYQDKLDTYGQVQYTWIGWDFRLYIIRKCDNTIIAWSGTYIVAWE